MILPNIDFEAYLKKNGPKEAYKLNWANHYYPRFLARLKRGNKVFGARLPWRNTHNRIGIKPGSISIWAGFNGHRKSLLTGQVACHFAREQKVCIASLEMQVEETLIRMCRQKVGGWPSRYQATAFMDWADHNLCLYDELQTPSPERILAMCYYSIVELKCEHVFIDSMAKCGISTDDYEGQTRFVDKLAWLAKATETAHIHLIAHCKKGDEEKIPGRYDIRGASQLSDLVDNAFICWSNVGKKNAVDIANDDPTAVTKAMEKKMKEPDQFLSVDKQRGEQFESAVGLMFDSSSLAFNERTNEV